MVVTWLLSVLQKVMAHQEDQALLKAYIAAWRKFFSQCNYLPMPFGQLEMTLMNKSSNSASKKAGSDESIVRKASLHS